MIKPNDGRILFLIKALVALLFLSKISLGAVLPIPQRLSFLIFQKGMHPFVNVFLCALLGLPLILFYLKVRDRHHLSPFYRLFLFVLCLTLTVQTLLQAHFVNAGGSLILQLGAAGMAIFMVLIYGVIIPTLWSPEEFVRFVQRWSGALVLLSLVLWLVASGQVYKGGRFIGVFKHIPHMVTCATVAFVFSLATFVKEKESKRQYWNLLILSASFGAIILTGTRSSAAAAALAFVLTLILHKTATNQGRLFKFSFLFIFVSYLLFFGAPTYEFIQGIATGQASLGTRQAQDGVASRWEEVQRGSEIFAQAPWLGHGLLSKFAAGDEVDVGNYNSMKDPHNIFISAGVIGGWPMLVLSVISLILMTLGSIKTLLSPDIFRRQIAIYLLAHIPILVIYHVHLSLGGMADRLYWLVFGFVAVASLRSSNGQKIDNLRERISKV